MYIAIDIGGTNIRIAFAEQTDTPAFSVIDRFAVSHNLRDDLNRVFESIDKNSSKNIKAIAVGIPGKLNEDKSILISARYLPEWAGFDFPSSFGQKYACPIWVDNDVVMMAFSERYGDLRDGVYVYLGWGTGIGGAQFKKDGSVFMVNKLHHATYLREFQSRCGGESLKSKFGKNIMHLSEVEWREVLVDFERHIVQISKALNIHDFFLAGGMTEKQRVGLKQVIGRLSEEGVALTLSRFGENAGIYGALSFIKYFSNKSSLPCFLR